MTAVGGEFVFSFFDGGGDKAGSCEDFMQLTIGGLVVK